MVVDCDEAYNEGWIAGYNDSLPDNPYPEETPEHSAYDMGYVDGDRNG